MIRPRACNAQDLDGSPRLPGGATERVEKSFLAHQSSARACQKYAAGSHGLQGQTVHVQIALERIIDRFPIARLLGGVQNDDIEALPRRQDVAEPEEQIGLDETDMYVVEL